MTSEKQFRELKFSSSQLAVVFLAILVVGVFIFLLGISVGKKQSRLSAESDAAARLQTEPVAQKTPLPAEQSAAFGAAQQQPQHLPPPEVKTAAPAEKKAEDKAASHPGLKPEAKPGPSDGTKPKTDASKPTETKPEPVKKAAPPPVRRQEGIFYVQIGAVVEKDAAEAFAQKVKNMGFAALVLLPLASDKTVIYRVRIGPYETKADAEAAKTKLVTLLKKKKTEFFIVKG